MNGENLVGKKFKYLSKSTNKESKWTGIIKEYHDNKVFEGKLYGDTKNYSVAFYKVPYIISENGIPYKLTEIKILD